MTTEQQTAQALQDLEFIKRVACHDLGTLRKVERVKDTIRRLALERKEAMT